MANEEARNLLDQLMGSDRNAPLPPGAAIPRKRAAGETSLAATALLLPGKRQKSCFDRDIDPLYTAWGIDVYELFKNTKSDLGSTNPNVVDEHAHQEFLSLTQEQQEQTGYWYFLFQKLQELVRQCDRIVSRNHEKLKQELSKKLSQRGGQDFVEDVEDAAVEALVVDMWRLEDMTEEWQKLVQQLEVVLLEEEQAKKQLEPIWEARKLAQVETNKEQEEQQEQEGVENKTSSDEHDIQTNHEDDTDLKTLQMELGKVALKKQRLLFEISHIMSLLAPLQESVQSQRRNLDYVKSDISTDKTVCEISGNFMSSRDADERIAAHYAGKQYVGWKLVRDKYKEMVQTYGRYGPPPPAQPQNVPPPSSSASYQRGRPPPPRDAGYGSGGGGGHWHRRGGGGYDRRAPPARAGGGWRR
ncbi:hypothetical protein FisN_8Lh035 [Fistulifera solaris]|uniref:Uncharacterized protein n=1 Tax=Fistulifera solaris TaxID=1519565 RepID=A0A1Z5JD73_FISSO|nr:hypothetical protein FisN_8Lh035 [Fistulifera solaris]|eukprot:GAX11947.1 hypothetical protein FisN_8Lh035 [Fistulifera solaris]